MRKISAILILFLLSACTQGEPFTQDRYEKGDSLVQKTDEINSLLEHYSTLSPFSDDENRFEVIDSVRNEITTRLLDVLNDHRIMNYPIEELINGDGLIITNSPDNGVYFFSIDKKTGGTYRASETIIHYRPSNGMVKAELFSGEASQALATSTFQQVYLLDDAVQKYFVIGGVSTCNTCRVMLAFTLQMDSDSIETDIIELYDGRHYDLDSFDYNSETRVFDFSYYAADKNDPIYSESDGKEGFRRKYQHTFRYMNGEFMETEKHKHWIPIK